MGPVWQGGGHGEDELLGQCYRNSLGLAAEKGIESIAFPAVSTGVYGFPTERATRIALAETVAFLEGSPLPREVVFVCFSAGDFGVYQTALDAVVGG